MEGRRRPWRPLWRHRRRIPRSLYTALGAEVASGDWFLLSYYYNGCPGADTIYGVVHGVAVESLH